MAIDELRRLREEVEEIRRRQRELQRSALPQRTPPPPAPTPEPSFERQARTEWAKEEAKRGRHREAGLAQPSHRAALPPSEGKLRALGVAPPSHPSFSPVAPPLPRRREDPRDFWTSEEWGRLLEGLGEPNPLWADWKFRWHRAIQEATQARLRSLPARELYGMYGYDPLGPAHPAGTRMEWDPVRAADPFGGSEELYHLLGRERAQRLRAPKGELLYYPRRGLPMPYSEMETPDVIMELGKRDLAQGYPWSEYGRTLIANVPWRAPLPTEHIGFYSPGEGPHGTVASGPESIVPAHEFAHAADWAQRLTHEERLEFRDDILDWLGDKTYEEMTPAEKKTFLAILNDNVIEAYAIVGELPQFIPPELERWYPQYDLTRRRAMGIPQPFGYRGPMAPPPPIVERK